MQKELLIGTDLRRTVAQYALNAKEAGLDGVVCSPREAGLVKEACGKGFLAVTPGIRFADAAADDAAASAPSSIEMVRTNIIILFI